jgi:predicted nucleic acid-binding Zn ribbon protein
LEALAKEGLVLMASYDYECPGDGEVITIERGMTEQEQDYACGLCGAKLKRIYHAPPVKFNGTGFYSTGG